jgi:hypothetical protein
MGQYEKHSDQFPYLVIRISSAVYNVIHRPADRPEKELIIDAIVLARKHNLKVCAVFEKDRCVYVEPDGTFKFHTSIPSGGLLLNNVKDKEILIINPN